MGRFPRQEELGRPQPGTGLTLPWRRSWESPDREITSRVESGFAIVSVKGKLVREDQGDLRQILDGLITQGTRGIALDFGAVTYIDSAGMGCCAGVKKLMRDKKCGCLVVFGASPVIAKMWKLIRLDMEIPLCATEAEARTRLQTDAPATGPGVA